MINTGRNRGVGECDAVPNLGVNPACKRGGNGEHGAGPVGGCYQRIRVVEMADDQLGAKPRDLTSTFALGVTDQRAHPVAAPEQRTCHRAALLARRSSNQYGT